MCGIAGWAGIPSIRDPERALAESLRAMSHRGPDGSGVFRADVQGNHTVALGHCRLAILDVSGGAQPMHSHDGRYVITFNGEIYNYLELRRMLIEAGCIFTSHSDTEVILEAYRTWGVECLQKFRGMFAFALLDRAKGSVLIARDPFGKKPLMLAHCPGGLLFASEVEALFRLGVERRLRVESLSEYVSCRYVRGPNTMFEGVQKLDPGSWLLWERGTVTSGQYFVPPASHVAPEAISQAEALARFGEVLEDAVRLRMRSDVPFGAYLSGGLDSSLIVALMGRHTPEKIRTFSVGFDDPRYSELGHADRVANMLGTRHTSLTVAPDQFLDDWPLAVRHRGAPVSEASDIPILKLSRMAGQSVKVILTGEGADEFFGGYPKYKAERWISTYQRFVPAGLHRSVVDRPLRAIPVATGRARILADMLLERDEHARGQLWFGSASQVLARELTGSVPADLGLLPFPSIAASPERRLQVYDQRYWLPDNLLERGDRMLMAGSVEGRMPFMDVELARVAAQLPDRFLMDHPRGKAIVRRFADGVIDEKTITRAKVGFKVPVGDWFRSGLRTPLLDLLTSGESRTRRLLNAARVDDLVSAHLDQRANNDKILWTLCNLELFLREFRLDAELETSTTTRAA
jgi:asparagine synthase (glutamine-hydrolysing)